MAEHTSLAAELFRAITAPKMAPIPAYLPESEAVNVDWYLQSEYARDYTIDIGNIHWGGEINRDHVFDIYKNFSAEKDSVKTRLAMLEFVANNVTRYTRNCYCYLRMNELTLDQWVKRMTHFDNGGDALTLYALSDLYGVHTTVITKSRPWTTVHGNYPGSLEDVLQLSSVKLAYLGDDQYAVLWKKISPQEPSIRQRIFNYTPMLPLQQPPTREDLETAETLMNLHQSTSANLPPPPTIKGPSVDNDADAMDKVVNRYDVNPKGRPLLNDAMDQITGISALQLRDSTSLCVETHAKSADSANLCVEMSATPMLSETLCPKAALCVETPIVRKCSVKLVSLESILFPRKGHTLEKHPSTGTDDSVPVSKNTKLDATKTTPKPSGSGTSTAALTSPSAVRSSISDANQPTLDDVYSAETEVDEPSPNAPVTSTSGVKRKYGCRLCKSRLESAQALKDHHVQTHGIMYCSDCNKAFNNQLSLTRHGYEHKSHPFVCKTCGEDFPFESQFKTHLLTHSSRRRFGCTHSNCNKHFKNKGDMNRHIKEHS